MTTTGTTPTGSGRRAFHALAAFVCAAAWCVAGCEPVQREPGQPGHSAAPAGDAWREFEGTASLNGSRRTLSMGGERRAAVLDLRGTLLLSGPARPNVGYHAEFIALSDTASGLVGRAVWTDERGDQAFSEVRGSGTAAENTIEGTFTGGTGRYTGVEGSYEFSWRYVLEAEDGSVQGRAVGLHGRVRLPHAEDPR